MIKKRLANIFKKHIIKEIMILVSLFLCSLLIRRIGVKHGFPLLTHPDESVIIDRVVHMTLERTLNPGNFNRPNQILYLLNFLYLNILSFIRFGEHLGAAFPKYYLNFYAYARFLISIMGAMIPVIAYKIGNEFRNKFGLFAALVFTLFPSYVLHSLYITPDVPVTLFTLLVIYFTVRYLKRGEKISIFLATLFAAITTAEKYPGLLTMLIVWTGIILNHFQNPEPFKKIKWWSLVQEILKFSFLFIIALFIVAPFIFIEYQQVIEALLRESRTTHLGADNLGWGGNLYFYLRSFCSWTNLLSILFISSGIYALIKNREKSHIFLFYGAIYWIALSVLSLHWERWALPMYITPLFLTGMGMNFLWKFRKKNVIVKYLVPLCIVVFLIAQFIVTLHIPTMMRFTDTRLIALNYAEQRGITPENSLYEGYSPFLPGHPIEISKDELENNNQYDYVILSSYMYDRFFAEPERYADWITFYNSIRENNRLIFEVEPTPPAKNLLERSDDILFYVKKCLKLDVEDRFGGPTIQIFELVR